MAMPRRATQKELEEIRAENERFRARMKRLTGTSLFRIK